MKRFFCHSFCQSRGFQRITENHSRGGADTKEGKIDRRIISSPIAPTKFILYHLALGLT